MQSNFIVSAVTAELDGSKDESSLIAMQALIAIGLWYHDLIDMAFT